MPRVRQYGAPQVQRTQLPGARYNADAPEAAFAPPKPIDTRPVLEAAKQEYEREKDKADQVAITSADSQLSAAETDMLVGQNGILNREGKDVFNAHDELVQNWQKTVDGIQKGLKTDRQKMVFAKQVAERWSSMDRQVQQHIASESKKYDAEQTDGLVSNERDAAIKLWTDPERIQQSIDRQVSAIKDFGTRHGASPEHVADMVSNAISATHAGVISQMLANDQDITAENYFKQHQDQINGATTTKLTKDLEEGSLRGKSQRESDKILATAKSRAESDEMVKAITDPKLRDEVDRRVDQGWRDRKERERESEDDNFKRATNLLESKGITSAAGVRAAIPPALWNSLPLSHRSALMSYAENELGNGAGSASRATADSKYLDFLDLEPEDLAKMTRAELETKYLQYLGKGDRRTAISRWDKARNTDPSEQAGLKSQFTLKDAITQSLAVNADQMSTNDKVFVATVEREVALKRERAARAKGKALTDSEEQAIVDDVVIRHMFTRQTDIRGETRRTLYGQVKVVNVDGNNPRVPLNQIPQRRQDEIRARIQGRVTNDKIERAYAAFAVGDMVRFNAIMGEQ